MNKNEYLLTCLSEECAEVAHRVAKAQRFTLEECQPGQDRSNAQRIVDEIHDLRAVIDLLYLEEVLPKPTPAQEITALGNKREKLRKFMAYSAYRGALSDSKVPKP